MDRFEIIDNLKQYFVIQELVGKWTYKFFGETSWKFFTTNTLYMLLIIRINLGKPITINNWHKGGRFSQRGLRTNLQKIFFDAFKAKRLYLSAHILGRAFDFDVKGMTANEVRDWLVNNANIFPFKVRLEEKLSGKYISWVHADTISERKNPKVYLFNA